MITDLETNNVFFSKLLNTDSRFSDTCQHITAIMGSFGVKYKFLDNTKDIWARDYMPIQVSNNKFIEYRYDPDYLQAKKYRNLKSYPDLICDTIGLRTQKTDLIIDGGNIIKSSNCVILTDKVIEENKEFYKPEKLIEKLREIFEVDKVALIPWDKKNDYLGHADGMMRFINNEKVLIQGYLDSYPDNFRQKLFSTLEKCGLNWERISFEVNKEDDRNWAYLNFLQTKDIILIPSLGIEEDDQALKQIKKYYPDYAGNDRIAQVDMTEIVKLGGALNCITWTVKD